MRDREWDTMNEPDFDSMLESSVPELPPDDVVQDVTPWRKSMNRILTGMALSALTLNFWNLNYILPAIGVLLSLLGFRTLRRENGCFKGCWIITIIRTAYFLLSLVLNATIFQSAVYASPVSGVLAVVNLVLLLLMFFLLWKGFRSVQLKAGLPAHAGGAAAMIVWYGAICLLALLRYSGIIIGAVMIILYVLILRSLYKLSKELDEAGYTVRAASVRVSDRAVAALLLALLTAGIACGYLFFNRYPMDWQPEERSGDAQVEQIKGHLIGLGFPEAILEDLAETDIRACEGALRVVVDVHDYSISGGRLAQERPANLAGQYASYDEELRITGIGVELPGEREQWKIFHHFLWTDEAGFYGTESIQLWPAYHLGEGWSSAGVLTGQLLYDMDGQSYAAPYYSLGAETYTSSSVFWGEQTSTDVFAAFSMPNKGENHRGYVSYTIGEMSDGWIVNAWINYTHQTSCLQYPVMTAKEKRMTNSWNDAGAFLTIQDALQFNPNAEVLEPFS